MVCVVLSLVLILMKQARINMEMKNPGAMRIYYSMCTFFFPVHQIWSTIFACIVLGVFTTNESLI